ncbi:MAG: hypothetical protein ACR5K9_00395 [Wolbachia sp.]
MAEVKGTSQKDVEKRFKDVFGRSPGPFPEGTSLEEKVNYIAKRAKTLKAARSKELESKMEDVAKLSKEFEKRKRQNDEEIDKLVRSTQELRKEFGYTATNKRSRLPQEAKQTAEASTQTDAQPSRAEGLRDNPEFQEAANNLKETTAEGEKFGQKKTSEVSVQTDAQPLVSSETKEPKSQAVDSSLMSRSLIRENKKLGQDEKDNTPQENQKEEGLFSLLKRFVKKVLEKLMGEDEKSVKNTHDTKGTAQKNTSNNEMQQKNKHVDKVLNQDQSIGEGLKQVTRLDNPAITPVNTPKVNEVNTGRER